MLCGRATAILLPAGAIVDKSAAVDRQRYASNASRDSYDFTVSRHRVEILSGR